MASGVLYVLRGVCLFALYGLTHYLLVDVSTSHWYLPSGLRFAALLLLPVRYWPWLYAGECASMLAMKMPWVWQRGISWTIVSTFTAMPPVAAAVLAIRRYSRLPVVQKSRDMGLLLLSALGISALTTAVNAACTYGLMLNGSNRPVPYVLGIYVLGQYLGILLFAPASLLWRNRDTSVRALRSHGLAAAIAGLAVCASLVATSAVDPTYQNETAQILWLLLGLAALVMTCRHGWPGAAIGAAASILVVGATAGPAYGPATLMTLQVVAFVATALLVAGAGISHHREAAKRQQIAHMKTSMAARLLWADSEQQNLEHVDRAKAAYAEIIRCSDEIIVDLRKAKRSEDIMRLTGDLMASTRSVAASLMNEIHPYIVYSADGLFVALRSKNLGEDVRYRTAFSGDSSLLSRNTSLAAYRVASAAIECLTCNGQTDIRLRMRVGDTTRGAGLYLRVRGNAEPCRSSSGTAATARLHRRVATLSGVIRIRSGEIAILIPDQPLEDEALDPSSPSRNKSYETSQANPERR